MGPFDDLTETQRRQIREAHIAEKQRKAAEGFWTADGWVPLGTCCRCPCECYRPGVPDDSGEMGWCDGCRMNIHSGDMPVIRVPGSNEEEG